jgi:hypothetical protein
MEHVTGGSNVKLCLESIGSCVAIARRTTCDGHVEVLRCDWLTVILTTILRGGSNFQEYRRRHQRIFLS